MNQYQVAWSCRGMCGTKLKIVVPWSSVLSCRMLSCRVVSHMCELSLTVITTVCDRSYEPNNFSLFVLLMQKYLSYLLSLLHFGKEYVK